MNDQVTLVIPTYNRAHMLKDAIESTLRQTYPYWEMIIVDDGSSDDTEATATKYQEMDARVKYYKNPRKGVSSARNYGVQDVVSVTFPTEGSASTIFSDKKIEARIRLLSKAEKVFSPLEAAWWQYTVGMDYYFLGEKNKAAEHFKKASYGDQRGIYHLAYRYFQLTKSLNGPFKRINLKVLSLLREFNFPTLVEHPVIGNQ